MSDQFPDESSTVDSEKSDSSSVTGILLLHGITGVPSEMRPLAKHLTRLGYRVEVPLLAGHGGTHQQLLAVSWQDWLDTARQSLDQLNQSCSRVIVGGLSLGALLAVLLAAENQRVDGIVLLSTALDYDGEKGSFWKRSFLLPLLLCFPFLDGICYWTEKPPYGLKDQRMQRRITRSIEAARRGESSEFGLFRTYLGSFRQLVSIIKETRKRAREVKCPALVVHSLEDTISTIKNPAEIYVRLRSKDKRILLLTGCDHVLTVDLCKAQVAQEVGKFVQDLVAKAGKAENPCRAA